MASLSLNQIRLHHSILPANDLPAQTLPEREATPTTVTTRPVALSRSIQIQGETFDLSSDWHLPMDTRVTDQFLRSLIATKNGDIFICAGDVFDAHESQDTSSWVSQLLTELAGHYSLVLYVPGNHCLRSKSEPWSGFNVPANVVFPNGKQPCVVRTEKNNILLGNILYDFKLIDPSVVGTTRGEISKFYAATHDGCSLMGGDTSIFTAMADNLARALTPDISVMVTHTLPHPAPITFRVDHLMAHHEKLAQQCGASFLNDPEGDARAAHKWGISPQMARAWWNHRCFMLGSNVINRVDADPRDGLIAIYGHNHQGASQNVRALNGSRVELVTHQPQVDIRK